MDDATMLMVSYHVSRLRSASSEKCLKFFKTVSVPICAMMTSRRMPSPMMTVTKIWRQVISRGRLTGSVPAINCRARPISKRPGAFASAIAILVS